jgi:hypothetical protein
MLRRRYCEENFPFARSLSYIPFGMIDATLRWNGCIIRVGSS